MLLPLVFTPFLEIAILLVYFMQLIQQAHQAQIYPLGVIGIF
jgi:hypothetical protein